MLASFKNILSIPDLWRRVKFTFLLLAVYRVGAHIPTPGINVNALEEYFTSMQGTILGLLDLFSGGALGRFTIMALGIMPYISASIILQLLTVVWPYLEKLKKEGEAGRKKITQYTRYGTGVICIIQALGISIFLEQQMSPVSGFPVVVDPGWQFRLLTIITQTTGTMFLMWLGEQITERGVGNGISLLIFAGIICDLPSATAGLFGMVGSGTIGPVAIVFLGALMIATIAAIVFVERAQRRIPIQYAKRVVGRKMMMGQSTHLPLKVNTGGVIPIIFASSIILIPQTISQFGGLNRIGWIRELSNQLNYGMPFYTLLYIAYSLRNRLMKPRFGTRR